MRDQLVCIHCWKWFDGRTTCPTCDQPLVHPQAGRVGGSAAGGPPSPAADGWGAFPAPPAAAGTLPPAPEGTPPVLGYPAGLAGTLAAGGDPWPGRSAALSEHLLRRAASEPPAAPAAPAPAPPQPPTPPPAAWSPAPDTPALAPPGPLAASPSTRPAASAAPAAAPFQPPTAPASPGWAVRIPVTAAPRAPAVPVPAGVASLNSVGPTLGHPPAHAAPHPPRATAPSTPDPISDPSSGTPAPPDPAPGSQARPQARGDRRPIFHGAAGALLAGLVLSAVWVAAAVVTGLELAPAALLVGAGVGLVMRRIAARPSLAAAGASGLPALIAIGIGLVLAALAAYSHAAGASYLAALALLDRTFLPHLWAETGAAGALLAVVGVLVAGLVAVAPSRVVSPRRARSLTTGPRGAV
jgi:hypothetical protein